MAGRPRKPTALKLLEGFRGKRPMPRRAPPAVARRPRMPRLVAGDPVAAKEWRRIMASMPPGFLTSADTTTLAVHCLAWSRMMASWQQVEADGLMATGSMNQPTAHPAIAVLDRQAALLLRCADVLGLHPAARARLDFPMPIPPQDDDGGGLLRG